MAAAHRRRNRRPFALPRPRVFRDRLNLLESLEEDEVYQRYIFRPASIVFITNGLSNTLSRDTQRNQAIPPLLQVLVFLRFIATGAHLRLVGDSLNISESSVGRIVKDVAGAIVQIFRNFINFPAGERAAKVMEGFRRIAGFPKVLGCVDGTQIRISTPTENEADFVNRKGFHSLNVQMVCDPNFRVTSLCARWPGSCHDSRVWLRGFIKWSLSMAAYYMFCPPGRRKRISALCEPFSLNIMDEEIRK
ncbi:putative nuclease HARBI1 [Saccostrea cucullata]|uniref:putative nuclease HARBI1 n=1 Tax=Saccostrea cuccullata TaxID=36930 RepID=UPI002ED463D5